MRLDVYRLQTSIPLLVGTIDGDTRSFSYASSYLLSPGPLPLSRSLPLCEETFAEERCRPYFEGLIPEGEARATLAAELGLDANDYLAMLEACGRDCIGDVLIRREGDDAASEQPSYEPLRGEALLAMFSTPEGVARENASSRLSLAGTQDKAGLAERPDAPGAWLRPHGLAASTHILKTSYLRDVPELEFVCMRAARACGVRVAEVSLHSYGRPVVAVRRFDRRVSIDGGRLVVGRLHQEDLAQALGVLPASKYAELRGGSLRTTSSLIRSASSRPIEDIRLLAELACFNYLVGNCDAHLKNLSLVWDEDGMRLSPGYDLVSTTYFPRFKRELAMELGGQRDIDAVGPGNFRLLAEELGITERSLKEICARLTEVAPSSIMRAGEEADALESTAMIAEDLLEDMAPRLNVLRQFVASR